MTAISITDLTNAKTDVDHIAEISTSTGLTATDRLGNTKDTVAGAVFKIASIFTSRGNWTAATSYAVKDLVLSSAVWYVCVTAHTASASFVTDAAKWRVYQGVTSAELSANETTKAAALITQPTEYTGEQPTSVFAILRGKANVKRFWVAGDGADWKNAFQKAAAAGARNIVVPGDVLYNVSDQVNILDDQDWYFDNAKVTLTDSTKVLFSAAQKSRWGIRGRSFLYGSLVTPATAVETGLKIDGGKRYVVEGLTAAKFKGIGIQLTGTVNPTALRGDRGHFSDIGAHENTNGIQVDVAAASEYNSWANTNASGNVIGMSMAAGNNTVIGGSIVDNTKGVQLTAGSNHCHGMFTGVNINHNTTYNLEAISVTNGHSFNGCNFYGLGGASGAIFLNGSKGIMLNGGHLDCLVYDYTGASSGYNYISDMYCPGSYGDIISTDASSLTPQELIFQRCYGPGAYRSGVSINDPGPVYLYATRDAGTAQAISGSTTLIFPSVPANGDRRRAYSGAGAFTTPANQAGQYRLSANLYFSGTAMSATGSYVQVLVNGLLPKLYLLTPYSTTILATTISQDMYLNAGDVVTITATVGGTTPVFGGPSWQSSVEIQRIS